jgi:type IV pilus biogenesis protein CpaD/CtpE
MKNFVFAAMVISLCGCASTDVKDGSVALTNVNQTYYWDLIRSQTERICPAKV